MKCRAAMPANDLPGGLGIETAADCTGKKCHVGTGGGDLHEVVVRNCSLLTYEVEVIGTCQTADIEYQGLGATWKPAMLTVPGEPGRRKTRMSLEQPLVSVNAGRKPTIRAGLSFGRVGRPKVAGTLVFQVETV